MPGTAAAAKRALLGRARATRELHHQLLPRWLALPVLSSNPLSSVAYATQEMMLVLAVAGAGALDLVGPLTLAVAALLVIVVSSHRQAVRAYPHGGGPYTAARENLGDTAGLTAAAALLVGSTLTVAVSVAAGVQAVVSAQPALAEQRLPLALAALALVTIASLRGLRQAGALLAVPTYAFVAGILVLLAVGAVRCGFGIGGCPSAETAGTALEPASAVTVLLVLRAFSSGAAALTGVEAIPIGVPAFRYPQSRNAAVTLAITGGLAVTMLTGVSLLARATGVAASAGMERTVVAQVALALLGDGVGFSLVQLATAAVLLLAASSAFADFPRLASVLARERWLPRQLLPRGDRLAFSNGILLLAGAAGALLVAYGADVTALVPLYIVGVSTPLTLSQAGMARHHKRARDPGWRRRTALAAAGAAGTALVLAVVAIATFTAGAWLVITAVPALALLATRVRRHYRLVDLALRHDTSAPEPVRPNHMLLLVDRVDEAATRALSYALATQPASLRALAVPLKGADVERRWAELAPDVPLEVLRGAGEPGVAAALRERLHEEAARRAPGAFTTAVIAETLSRSWFDQLRSHRLALRLKATLPDESGLVVTDVTSPEGGPGPYTVEEPVEHHVVVLLSAVNAATMRALAYARGLGPASLRALSVNLDPERTTGMLAEWADWDVDTPIEIVDSPFRSLTGTVRSYVHALDPDGRHTTVTCVLPELVVERAAERPLHNHSAAMVKAALLFERGVVTTTVPYPLRLDRAAATRATPPPGRQG